MSMSFRKSFGRVAGAGLALLMAGGLAAEAQEQGAELAKKLSNPISDLISMPLQYNYNEGLGTGNGKQSYINIQPVIPFSISDDWNVISRTILPVISQDNVIPGEGSQFGTGQITQSLFFSPKAPTSAGLIWGVGPAFMVPTATDGLGTNQWALGATGVGLTQKGPWTLGLLANHLWSVTGNSRHGEMSNTFVQPFVSYTTAQATSFSLNTETTYDWEDSEWSVPINALVSQVLKLGEQPIQVGAGARYWAQSPEGGADGWGARLQLTFLFPKN